ncbi:MAG: hypothetical protein PHG63_03735 [Candidatus Dojkabacteria bacterium]|nr:hypothetical protein [Candidatus Dojkabacteria bacterium]
MLQAGIKFNLGRLYLTRGVNDLVAENLEFAKFVNDSLRRHANGDWGEMCREDRAENQQALVDGTRLLSVYQTAGKPKIWIITEADRSATTALFPDEY